jgi:hypothetical protein
MSDVPRRPGRPPIGEDGTPARVNLTVPAAEYDKAASIARRDGVSVPEVIRRGLHRYLSDDPDPPQGN